ncbi:MAG: hypothetical protein ACP5HW_03555 [Candidatus Micrarchaeia archaeon]
MIVIEDTKNAFNIIMHPGKISETMTLGKALKFYYSVAVIPPQYLQ